MEDSRNALFVEPNAYIQKFDKTSKKDGGIKKVVFQEPYDCLPTYHMDNNFKKGNCDCVSKPKQKPCENKKPNFNFDLKSLLPMLNMLGKNSGGLGNIMSLLGGDKTNGGFDFSSLLDNTNLLSNLTGLFGKKKTQTNNKKELICTDYEIKKYTKV